MERPLRLPPCPPRTGPQQPKLVCQLPNAPTLQPGGRRGASSGRYPQGLALRRPPPRGATNTFALQPFERKRKAPDFHRALSTDLARIADQISVARSILCRSPGGRWRRVHKDTPSPSASVHVVGRSSFSLTNNLANSGSSNPPAPRLHVAGLHSEGALGHLVEHRKHLRVCMRAKLGCGKSSTKTTHTETCFAPPQPMLAARRRPS